MWLDQRNMTLEEHIKIMIEKIINIKHKKIASFWVDIPSYF